MKKEDEFNYKKYVEGVVEVKIKEHGDSIKAIFNMDAIIADLKSQLDGAHDIINDVEQWLKKKYDTDIEKVLNEVYENSDAL
jgi:predicted component of type VI protein secretion system